MKKKKTSKKEKLPGMRLQALSHDLRGPDKLACEIALGPLAIKTEASLDQVSELILRLVREYREVPSSPQRGRSLF